MTYKLINDDCLNAMYYIPDESVDAIITDPPYGILNHKIERGLDIAHFMTECHRVLKPNGFMIYFGQQPTLTNWNSEALKLFNYKNEVIWYKRQNTSPMQDMGRVFENIMIVCKGKRQFNDVRRLWLDVVMSLSEFIQMNSINRTKSYMVEILENTDKIDEIIKARMGDKSVYKMPGLMNDDSTFANNTNKAPTFINFYSRVSEGYHPQNLVSFITHNKQRNDMSGQGKGAHNIKHPTVKPIQLIEYLITLVSNQDDVILDPFIGSGTTALAGLNTGRYVIGIEIDPGYHMICQQRINDWLGQSKQEELF